ncbi:MAG: hypothetical protein JWN11_1351 [Hyphomicrobiales bacterium]|nr:hypothetical protein [Hyphomicrobiales bacterium]
MSSPATDRRRFPSLAYGLILAAILLLALLPLISVLVASSIAEANGCPLDEGSVHACLVAGHDLGELLYTLGVLGWLMLASLPLGGIGVIVWLVILIIHHAAWARSNRKAAP